MMPNALTSWSYSNWQCPPPSGLPPWVGCFSPLALNPIQSSIIHKGPLSEHQTCTVSFLLNLSPCVSRSTSNAIHQNWAQFSPAPCSSLKANCTITHHWVNSEPRPYNHQAPCFPLNLEAALPALPPRSLPTPTAPALLHFSPSRLSTSFLTCTSAWAS